MFPIRAKSAKMRVLLPLITAAGLVAGCAPKLTAPGVLGGGSGNGTGGSTVDAISAATSLSWSEGAHSTSTTIHAQWTKASSNSLSNQKIQLYSDGSCTVASGALVDLNSGALQTYAFAGVDGSTYTFIVQSFDSSGNSLSSACSSAVAVDTTAPNAATALSWAESSPHNGTTVTAQWTKSNSADLANQKIQFYTDAGCTTTSGSLIKLASTATQSYSFTGSNGNTYYFVVSSIDTAGNATPSACSSGMLIDTTAPNAATSLGWSETSPHNGTGVTASWTKSNSADLANQKIQFYSDGTCTTTSGSLVDLASAATQTQAFTGVNGSTYTYKITSIDSAGNSTVSACSSAMVIDTSAPNSATSLGWTESSPSSNTTVHASWTKSNSADLSNQKIQFYDDGTCTHATGLLIDLASAATQTQAFTGSDGNTYTYKVTSIDSAGNSTTSGCSSAMVIDTSAPNAATVLGWSETSPHNSTSVTASWTKSNSGDLSNQKIQFYADGTCTSTSGGLINLSSNSTQTYAFTGVNGTTYTYKVTSYDTAGNPTTSACSSSMLIDTTAPNAATAVTWVEASPSASATVTASWTKSNSADLNNQKIKFYADGTCSTTTGSLIDLASAATQTKSFTGGNGSTYSFIVTSFDAAGNSTDSACSSSMTITIPGPNAATSLAWAETSPHAGTAVTAQWTKSNSGSLTNHPNRTGSFGYSNPPSWTSSTTHAPWYFLKEKSRSSQYP